MASIEEKVEEHYKKILDELGIRHYGKTESINRTITDALRSADSKSGGSGNNYPDIQLLLENKTARRIPVMIEAKGLKNRLEKISKSGQIELITYYEKDSKRKDGTIQHHAGDANYSSIMNYAVNGAVHYANAILDSRGYTEVIAIGINGTQMNADGSVRDAECRAYYISEKNNRVPKHKLTTEDQETLNKKATFKPFRIGDLFVPLKGGYIGTGKKIGSATKARSEEYCIPLTCAKLGDNGIMYWGKKGDFRTYTNAISIIADGAVSAGLVYAQPEEAGVYSHSYFIRLENVEVSYRTNLYLASVLNKVLYPKYSRERPPRWENKVENDSILLPVTAEGQPDYSYMEQYIRVQEKLAIRDAIQLKDRIIEETKCVVGG